MEQLIAEDWILSRIYEFRKSRVMLDRDLARLYDVPTKVLNQAVKRNIQRFPEDFMFRLSEEESQSLRSQIVTLDFGLGQGEHSKYLPYAFTENGIAMLSSVLSSDRAIEVNIQIMRTFTRMRKIIFSSDDLKRKIDSMEKKYDNNFKIVFDAIRKLLVDDVKPKRKIGF